ncbi:unnamed protein product [Toxocara canis]|uniref:mRNA_decap_C domain-containing protein n=1 Tax=Toxocara canis TaxID=6265 RepID=A0A183U1E4_TOXCA|nr:unnamed protein product [Toxocara canis]
MSDGSGKKARSVDAMNLTSVQRIDPCAVAIVDKSTHAALYSFDAVKEEWTKTDIEGPLLIHRRADRPAHSMINEITGLWFYERDDCIRIYKLLTRLVAENDTQSPAVTSLAPDANFDVLSLSSRAHTQSVPLGSTEHTPTKNHQDTSANNANSSKCGTYEMPVMLQKLLCEESGIAKRTMPTKGALNADQIEKQLVHGESNHLLLDKLAVSHAKLPPNYSSVSLGALSTTAVGGSDSGTIPDEAANTEQSFSRSACNNKTFRVASELKRSCSANDTNTAPIVPLTKEQMLQALTHLLRMDDDFVVQLHRAYVDSLNYRLGL